MIALVAGTGPLPGLLIAQLQRAGRPVALVCQMEGYPVTDPGTAEVLTFRMEHLGSVLRLLRARGVSEVCLAGLVRRPVLDPARVDAATEPLIAHLAQAMRQGDDGTLRAIVALFEGAGLRVRAAHEIAPDLLPAPGLLSRTGPTPRHRRDARRGEAVMDALGAADVGQGCVVRNGQVLAVEAAPGTDWMLQSLAQPDPAAPDHSVGQGALFFKAPKPGQDRRIDLPAIGPQTLRLAAAAGLSAVVIEAGGVMAFQLETLREMADRLGLVLWVRRRGEGA